MTSDARRTPWMNLMWLRALDRIRAGKKHAATASQIDWFKANGFVTSSGAVTREAIDILRSEKQRLGKRLRGGRNEDR